MFVGWREIRSYVGDDLLLLGYVDIISEVDFARQHDKITGGLFVDNMPSPSQVRLAAFSGLSNQQAEVSFGRLSKLGNF